MVIMDTITSHYNLRTEIEEVLMICKKLGFGHNYHKLFSEARIKLLTITFSLNFSQRNLEEHDIYHNIKCKATIALM